MIIRLALSFFAVALLLLLAMAGLYKFGWLGLANLLRLAGTETLLVGGALLVLLGLAALLQSITRQLRAYFSTLARAQRRLGFTRLQQEQQLTVFANKTRQQLYFANLTRKRLLRTNTCKHSQQLASSIQRDLTALRLHLPRPTYQQLQKQLTGYSRQQDVDSLLKLQQQLITYVDDYDARPKAVDNAS